MEILFEAPEGRPAVDPQDDDGAVDGAVLTRSPLGGQVVRGRDVFRVEIRSVGQSGEFLGRFWEVKNEEDGRRDKER